MRKISLFLYFQANPGAIDHVDSNGECTPAAIPPPPPRRVNGSYNPAVSIYPHCIERNYIQMFYDFPTASSDIHPCTPLRQLVLYMKIIATKNPWKDLTEKTIGLIKVTISWICFGKLFCMNSCLILSTADTKKEIWKDCKMYYTINCWLLKCHTFIYTLCKYLPLEE